MKKKNENLLRLWYDKPANDWQTQALAIGNGYMGGLIFGLLHYKSDKQALEFATAASCLKHTLKGDFNWVTISEVENLMNGDASGRVKR